MINLSFDELRLIEKVKNISGYESKSKEDLIKTLSEPKPEIPKPEIPKTEIPKPETPKLNLNFLKKKYIGIKKAFYDVYENLSLSKIKRASKSLNKF